MRFVLIRHGQSANNLLWEQTGDSVGRHHDPELTDLGHAQAARLAEAAAEDVLPWPITQLHTSLMTRAVQTAAPLADVLDLPLQGHVDAHETGGVFVEDDGGVRTAHRGATSAALLAASNRLVLPDELDPEGWFTGPVDADDAWNDDRARQVVAGLRERHEDDDVVALVTHGAFFQHLFRALLGIEAMTGWVVKHNTALSLFADEELTDGATVSAHQINWMPHLPPELVSI